MRHISSNIILQSDRFLSFWNILESNNLIKSWESVIKNQVLLFPKKCSELLLNSHKWRNKVELIEKLLLLQAAALQFVFAAIMSCYISSAPELLKNLKLCCSVTLSHHSLSNNNGFFYEQEEIFNKWNKEKYKEYNNNVQKKTLKAWCLSKSSFEGQTQQFLWAPCDSVYCCVGVGVFSFWLLLMV